MKGGLISLCSGIGCFDYVAKEYGIEILAQCEKDEYCNKVLEKNFGKAIKRFSSVESFETENFFGRCFLLTSGFPCQPFSLLGEQQGVDDTRYIWPAHCRIIREVKPRYIILENVAAIAGTMAFQQVCDDLEKEGYNVWPATIPAAAANADHIRYRTFFLAYSSSLRVDKNKIKTAQPGEAFSEENKAGPRFSIVNSRVNKDILQGLSQSDILREITRPASWIHRTKALGNAIDIRVLRRLFKVIIEFDNCVIE